MLQKNAGIFLSLCFILLSTAASASELYGKISYKGAPLKGAEISVQDKKLKTNDIGFYSVELAPGSYMLEIKLPDGSSKSQKVEVYPQDTEKNLKID